MPRHPFTLYPPPMCASAHHCAEEHDQEEEHSKHFDDEAAVRANILGVLL